MSYSAAEARPYLTEFLALDEQARVASVHASFGRWISSGALAGETPKSSIERYFETKFKPSVAIWATKNDESARKVAKVLEEKSPEITSAVVAAAASLIARQIEGPYQNERLAVIGFAAVVLMVGLKANKVDLTDDE